ncbi:Clp protease N-terminal domain-containing protein [Modestobacter sp. VKM Ac-2984]|uniref:Clp protease N-terminal domain-containing protein n=1 Tax=Modestobacter sp. VKM Ac-2984 TaxID=3004138 RepID=UPI0022AA078A|nr:Clp protease N-terminal domain-containing protein [Modestobacter sp. VKM Ac-2984]MCZ2815005.1 Clp protease [Modestobacter sp. VKM Ac-2984]
MFERFTREARQVVVIAQAQARWLHAEQVEPVHLLLALTTDPGRGGQVLRAAGVDPGSIESALARSDGALDGDALAAIGIDLDQVRAAAESAFGQGALNRGARERSGHLPFTDGSKRALEESLRHVLRSKVRRRARAIDSGALLAGLLAVDDPVVTRVLRQLGTDADRLRGQLGDASAA